MQEFSFRSRKKTIKQMQSQEFDALIIGGGITGAATARDATMRGLKVALVEKSDFAEGTSSRSSKLVHGGFRYLENMEFGLVFEALSERTNLLKTAPTLVKPLRFYFPVYKGDKHGRFILSLGMWFYDVLALFRSPGFHKRLSQKRLSKEIPFLKTKGLKGGFKYYDASMWDDVLTVEILRDAHEQGAAVANYVEAREPIFEDDQLKGFTVKDHESGENFQIKAKKVIVCAGPWTDLVGAKLKKDWRPWLKPSKGVHLVFDLKKIPVPGAMVMTHPRDGRISFVIPREDMGNGIVIVGTTDSPTPDNPDNAEVAKSDINYLLDLLNRYYPSLNIIEDDILSAYVGVRPLMGGTHEDLQKVSREHYVGEGPGGAVIVAGGKYTTHRTMAQEIVDYTFPKTKHADTKKSFHPKAVLKSDEQNKIEEYLKYEIQNGMVVHLSDFLIRRTALFLSRKDHALPFVKKLAELLIHETERPQEDIEKEVRLYKNDVKFRDSWRLK